MRPRSDYRRRPVREWVCGLLMAAAARLAGQALARPLSYRRGNRVIVVTHPCLRCELTTAAARDLGMRLMSMTDFGDEGDGGRVAGPAYPPRPWPGRAYQPSAN